MRIVATIFIVCIGMLVNAQRSTQRPAVPTPTNTSTQIEPQESNTVTDTIVDNELSSFKRMFSGKPGKAALYSLMVPGWGQVYNGKAWKVPLVYALEGAAVYFLINNVKKYNQYNNCYRTLVSEDILIEDCGRVMNVSDAFLIRQNFRKQRELSYIYVVVAHLFQSIEAFIDRHLVDFDIDEDLSFQPIIPRAEERMDTPIFGIYVNLSPTHKTTKALVEP